MFMRQVFLNYYTVHWLTELCSSRGGAKGGGGAGGQLPSEVSHVRWIIDDNNTPTPLW